MAHFAKFTPSLKWNGDKFYIEVTATSKDKSATVYKAEEDGKLYARYLYSSYCSGYLVVYPGEEIQIGYYYNDGIQQEEEYEETTGELNCDIPLSICKEIAEKRSDLKYLMQKITKEISLPRFIKLVALYKDHQEVEILVNAGFYEIALNKSFWKYKENKRKEICDYIRKYLVDVKEIANKYYWGDINVKKLKLLMSKFPYVPNVSLLARFEKNRFDLTDKQYNYITKKNIEIQDYINYMCLVKKMHHSLKDEYWLCPSHFEKRFDKLKQEEAAVKNVNNAISKAIINRKLQSFEELSKNTRRVICGYEIYIPYNVDDIIVQAEALNQCLISRSYHERMSNGKDVLIFARDAKSHQPVATLEIDWNKNKIQCYANESSTDRALSLPTEEVNQAFTVYLEYLKLVKPKIDTSLDNLKGYFKGVYEGKKAMAGNVTYEVGKVYDTGVSDEEFNEKCKSSNKAIHFCKDITKVENFIKYKEILIVEPLGKICNIGDEYFSNKIKILDVVNI